MFQSVASLTDNLRGVIYDRNVFIMQATDLIFEHKDRNVYLTEPYIFSQILDWG
jgi:hypothetical protein